MTAAVAISTMVTAASAAVYTPQQQLPPATIQSFNSNPDQLLGSYPAGGAPLISRVRDLAASDPSTLQPLIGLLKKQDQALKDVNAKLTTATGAEARDLAAQAANLSAQVRGIASGLAQVARLASRTDQAYANEIQSAVAGSGSEFAIASYQASVGDTAIAAGAGGGGAGGGGTGTGGSTGTSGLVFGGNNSGASSFGGLHYSTLATSPTTGSVGGTSNSVSPR